MGRIDTELWQSDWELSGSPLYQGSMKSEPIWSYHASIETIKKSPRKLLQDQSIHTSCFLSLETIIRGSVIHAANDRKEPFRDADIGGNDHSLAGHLGEGSSASQKALSSSKPLPLSPPRPASGREHDGRLQDLALSIGKSSNEDGSSNVVMEETKDCAEDNQASVSTRGKTTSRYEKLQRERLKIRDKIAQRKVGRQGLLPFDSNPSRRKTIDSQNDEPSAASFSKLSSRASLSGNRRREGRLQAAILIQTCARRFFARNVLAAKEDEAQRQRKAEFKRLQQQQSCSSYPFDRTARVNVILEQIKVRELYHKPFQLGKLSTIQEE
ncbi:unnamed protein product [Cylindrotheca closterium]|uniref:Uncharacterized protein n=1 Tax=Cylindrotheca closterium TaxID=2856 RepID=A0AAD2FTC6_9STRA|nr:unnamed protein product [Cylindrotheca closterium]